jgi:hypothetical protein
MCWGMDGDEWKYTIQADAAKKKSQHRIDRLIPYFVPSILFIASAIQRSHHAG